MQIYIKIKTYTFVFFLILGINACGGDASTTTEESTENTDTSSQTEKRNTEEISSESTTNTEKVGFEKMIEALFASGFPSSEKPKILKEDIANGYLEFEANQNGTILKYPGQIGYFTTSSGEEILVTALPSCMQACGYGLSFFQMEGEKLIMKPTESFIEGMGMETMNEFGTAVPEQMRAKMTDAEKEAQKKGAMGLYDQIITIPQQGTTITFEKITNLEGEKKKILVAELQYNVETGTFTFVKK